jgi:HEAT repeat protein
LSLAEDSGPSIRGDAISALGSIHSEPDLVVPVLVRALEDPEAAVRGAALWALQDFGKAASSATPVLTQKLTQGVESNERAIMLNTLAAIGSTNSVLKP